MFQFFSFWEDYLPSKPITHIQTNHVDMHTKYVHKYKHTHTHWGCAYILFIYFYGFTHIHAIFNFFYFVRYIFLFFLIYFLLNHFIPGKVGITLVRRWLHGLKVRDKNGYIENWGLRKGQKMEVIQDGGRWLLMFHLAFWSL